MADDFDPSQYERVETPRESVDPSKMDPSEFEQVQAREPDMSTAKIMLRKNLDQAREAEAQKAQGGEGKPKREPIDASVPSLPAEGFVQSLMAGWGIGNIQQFLNTAKGEKPTFSPADHASRMERIASMVGELAGNAPTMTLGGIAGAAFGSGVGLGYAGPAGVAPGLAVGGAAGAFAAPAFIRSLLAEQYEKGPIKTAGEFADRFAAATWEAIKQGGVGALTGVAGVAAKPLAAGLAEGLGASANIATRVGQASATAAEISTMATASAGLEKRLPNWEDFENAAIPVAGLHGIPFVAKKIMGIWKATGTPVPEIVQDIQKDPELKSEVLSIDPEKPKIEVPPIEEQEKLGLKPVNPDGTIAEEKPDEPPPPKEIKEGERPALDKADLTQEEKQQWSDILEKEPEEDEADKNKPLQDKVKDQVKSIRTSIMDKASDFFIKHFDYTRALREAMLDTIGDPEMLKKLKDNPEVLAIIHSAIGDKVQDAWDNGTREFGAKTYNGEGAKAIFDDYKAAFPDDKPMNGLRDWMIANRVLEKQGQGIEIKVDGKPIDTELARKIVEAGREQYQPYADRLVGFKNRILKYAKDSGLFSDDQFNAMVEKNKAYFPFYRVQEIDERLGDQQGGAPNRRLKKLVGEGGKIVDPFVGMIRDTDMLIRMAEENKIKQASIKYLETEDENSWLRKSENQIRPIKVLPEEVAKAYGIDPGEVGQGFDIFRPAQKFLDKGSFDVYVEGKRFIYEGVPSVVDALNRLRGNATATDTLSKLLMLPRKILTVFTTANPAFALRHAIRNEFIAATYSKTGIMPFATLNQYAQGYFDKTGKFKDALYDGAFVNTVDRMDKDFVQSKIYEMDKQYPFLKKAWNYLNDDLPGFTHAAIIDHDNILRLAEYSRTLEKGGSREEAAFNARQVLPDFQRAGLNRAFLLQQVAFLNVHVQSIARMNQEFIPVEGETDQAYRARLMNFVGKNMAMITLPATLIAAANGLNDGDKQVDRLEWYQRLAYWNIHIPRWENATSLELNDPSISDDLKRQTPDGTWQVDHGFLFKTSLPFFQGNLFGGVVQATMDAWKKKDPGAFGEWAKQVAESLGADLIPTWATAPYETLTNYNHFTGRPIVPMDKERLLPEFQYEPYTSEVAKGLGKLIGTVPYFNQPGGKLASPLMIDNWMRDWGGQIGRYIVRLADAGLRESGAVKKPSGPEPEMNDIPILGEFTWRHGTFRTQEIDQFIKNYNFASAIAASTKELQKEHADPLTILQMQDKYKEYALRQTNYFKGIQNMKHAIFAIDSYPDSMASPVQKRQLEDAIYYKANLAAQEANKQFEIYQNQVKNIKEGRR